MLEMTGKRDDWEKEGLVKLSKTRKAVEGYGFQRNDFDR